MVIWRCIKLFQIYGLLKKKIENWSKCCWKNVRSLRYFANCTHNSVWEHNFKLFSEKASEFKQVFFVVYIVYFMLYLNEISRKKKTLKITKAKFHLAD